MRMKKTKQLNSLRNDSIELLIDNEEKYAALLECIVTNYSKPSKTILTTSQHKKIFCNIEQIVRPFNTYMSTYKPHLNILQSLYYIFD